MKSSSNSGAETSAPSDFVTVGRVKDAHGIKGELYLQLFAGEAEWLDLLNKDATLRLISSEDSDAQVRAFNLKSARLHKKGLIAKTSDIPDRNGAEALIGWIFQVPADYLVSEKGETIYLREIQGFRAIVKGRGEVGTIVNFGTNGAQDLLILETPEGEFEIPFVEAFVQHIDYDAKSVSLDLPVGLLGEALDE